MLSGINPERDLVEIVELPDHPFFVGVQFHPEFKSTPLAPHPIFRGFVAAALTRARAPATPEPRSRPRAGQREPSAPAESDAPRAADELPLPGGDFRLFVQKLGYQALITPRASSRTR